MPSSVFWSIPSWLRPDRINNTWWGLDPVVPPADEPVTIDDVKKQARVTGSFEDTIIAGFLVAARLYVEKITNRFMLPQTWDFWLQDWPNDRIFIPRAPLISVAYLNYTDLSEQANAVPLSVYDVNTTGDPGSIVRQFGQIWPPGPLSPSRPINARFTAGYARFAGTVSVTSNKTVTWVSGDKFDTSWTPMSWFVIDGTSYPILTVNSQTVLTLAVPVTPANPTGAAYSFNLVPQPLKLAIMMLAGHLYTTREPIAVGRGLVSVEIGKTFDSLVDNYRVNTLGLNQIR